MDDNNKKMEVIKALNEIGANIYSVKCPPTYFGSQSKKWRALAEKDGKKIIAKYSDSPQREYRILQRLIDVPQVPKPIYCRENVIITEFHNGSLLTDFNEEKKPSLDNLRKELVNIIKSIHRHQVVHCDIRPWNILLDCSHNITIFDFGYSFILNNNPPIEIQQHLRERGHKEPFNEGVDDQDIELSIKVLSGEITPENAWNHREDTFSFCFFPWKE